MWWHFFVERFILIPKLLDLVSRNVGPNPDIQISARLFITANYQHSQNLQNLSIRVNNTTLAQQGLGTKPGVGHGLPAVNKLKKKMVKN